MGFDDILFDNRIEEKTKTMLNELIGCCFLNSLKNPNYTKRRFFKIRLSLLVCNLF